MPIATKQLDLNEIINSFNSVLRGTIGENIDIKLELSPNFCQIQTDQSQIQQILINLAVNAQDAITGSGTILIETSHIVIDDEYCHSHPGTRPGRYIMLSVKDSGSGMDDRTLTHVFEPFFTTKPVGKGTGLGLATVYGIVKQHDGFVNVQSTIGKGTIFRIYFPEQLEGKQVETPLSNGKIKQDTVLGTVLLVEDNMMVLNIARELLESCGHNVLVAATPEAALAIARERQGKVDLLVTDVVMPQMNGPELHERLLEIVPGHRVLYISGYASNMDVHRGELIEGINFLPKPFSSETFLHRVSEILQTDR